MWSFIFGPPPIPPDELITKWKQVLSTQKRELDNRIEELKRLDNDTVIQIRLAAKEKEVPSIKILTKELLYVRNVIAKLYETGAMINSVSLQLSEQLAQIRLTKAIAASTVVMKNMNQLVTLPMIGETMQQLSKEMHQAGLIRDVMSDVLAQDDFEIGEAADEEVDKFLDGVAKEWKLPDIKHVKPVLSNKKLVPDALTKRTKTKKTENEN